MGAPPAGPPVAMGAWLGAASPFAMQAERHPVPSPDIRQETSFLDQQSGIPVMPSSGEETILPGWVRTIGAQVASLQVRQEEETRALRLEAAEREQTHAKQMGPSRTRSPSSPLA